MIYAIQAGEGGPVKFGVAKNPSSRLRELQTGNPLKLRLVAEVDILVSCERQIHHWLREERLQGEWFGLGPKTLDVLGDLQIRQVVGGDQLNPDPDAYEAEMIRRDGRKPTTHTKGST